MLKKTIKKLIKKILKFSNHFIASFIRKIIIKKQKTHDRKHAQDRKKIIIDCSFIYSTNLNTGIQRVVNNIVKNISTYAEAKNIDIVTVALQDGFITQVDLNDKQIDLAQKQPILKIIRQKLHWYVLSLKNPVMLNRDDILLMLDSSWYKGIWESVEHAKKRDIKVIGVIYDLIPISNPEFCDDYLAQIFSEFLNKSLQYFDGYIAISKTVMLNLKDYIKNQNLDVDAYFFDYFRLGTDLKSTGYSLADIRDELKDVYQNQSVYLTVSTIEPRKNHQYLFDTFNVLWEKGIDATLVIVGKEGWKTETLVQAMRNSPEYKKRLYIFNDLDDNELSYCYDKSKALLFASFVEGFGLPIIEALQNRLPVLASDIPIHREVGDDLIDYFDIYDERSLVSKIQSIESGKISLKEVDTKALHINTWKDSTKELFDKIF